MRSALSPSLIVSGLVLATCLWVPATHAQEVEIVLQELKDSTKEMPKLMGALDAAAKPIPDAISGFGAATSNSMVEEFEKVDRALGNYEDRLTDIRTNLRRINRALQRYQDLDEDFGPESAAYVEATAQMSNTLHQIETLKQQLQDQANLGFASGESARKAVQLLDMVHKDFGKKLASSAERATSARSKASNSKEGLGKLLQLTLASEAMVENAEAQLSITRSLFQTAAIIKSEHIGTQEAINELLGKDAEDLKAYTRGVQKLGFDANNFLAAIIVLFRFPELDLGAATQLDGPDGPITILKRDCPEGFEVCAADCRDSRDNDGDGKIDCDDPDCAANCLDR